MATPNTEHTPASGTLGDSSGVRVSPCRGSRTPFDIYQSPADRALSFGTLKSTAIVTDSEQECGLQTCRYPHTNPPEDRSPGGAPPAKDDTDRISQQLVQLSREQGSSDNISVIVVFLREPSKIAAEAHWANRNRTPATMDAGLDNANNPFAISNGAPTDNIISQKSDGLLLNLTDNFKQNGTDTSPAADFYTKEKANGKRSASEFDDDDFGPETNVDTVDDVLSPVETARGFGDIFGNNNPAEGVYNPFMEYREKKAGLEIERELQKQQSEEFEEQRLAREETPTPPADAVHDVSGLVDNAAESESEDEWNYFKGDEANKENISPQPDKEVAEVPEEDDNMSQLNPNAAEFVPVSPTRSIPSPACRTLLNDQVISQSPRRPATNDIDISVPNPAEFENEVKSRPSDVDSYSNGHGDTSLNRSTDLMETLLNGKNIDEIPEFQPGSTPTKIVASEEFHFGPNAAPFTPAKLLDQSEAALSTRAVYGDESTATLNTSFNESVASQDTASDLNILNKESDPMSMSFYADKGDGNPFDLNEVHVLPDNIDEYLKKPDNSMFNDTISDLPEHHPLGEVKDTTEDLVLNNDDAIQTTDLDKGSYYEEKELASPLEPEKELSEPEREMLGDVEECDFSKTPEPTHENLLSEKEFCSIPENPKTPERLPRDVELISPELRAESTSPRPESYHEDTSESKSPLPEATEVPDLLAQPEILPRDVELISPELGTSRPDSTHEELSESPRPESKSPVPEVASEVDDLLESKSPFPEAIEVNVIQESKSPLPGALEVDDLLKADSDVSSKSPLPEVCELPQSKTPTSDILEANSPVPDLEAPVCELPVSKSPFGELESATSPLCELRGAESPVCELRGAKSQICEIGGAKSPVCEFRGTESPIGELRDVESPVHELRGAESPVCELPTSKSPAYEYGSSQSPVCERPISKSPVFELESAKSPVGVLESAASPVCEFGGAKSPVFDREVSKSPVCELGGAKSPVPEFEIAESPVCERPLSKSPVCERPLSKSPVCELEAPKSPLGLLIESKSPVQQFDDEVCTRPTYLASPDFTKEEEIQKAYLHFDAICKAEEPVVPTREDHTTPEVIEMAQEKFDDIFKPKSATSPLESPQEDVTSSLKEEDVVSPAKSPIPDQIIEDSFVEDRSADVSSVAQEVAGVIQESVLEVSSTIPETCPIPTTTLIEDTGLVTTPEVNTLELSLPPDVASPSPTGQQLDNTMQFAEQPIEEMVPKTLDLDNVPVKCFYQQSTEIGEQIDIKTENITPEFAEQAIVTPSEESKQEEVPTAPLVEEPVKEPAVGEKKAVETASESVPTAAVAAAAVGVAAAAAAVTATKAKTAAKAETEEKKKPGVPPAKKPVPAKTASKTTTKASTTSKPASRLSASPKTTPAKTGTAKPATTATAPKPAATKPSPKPKPAAAPKSTEKKSLANGDIKSSARSTLASKKTVSETTSKSTTSRPASSGTTRLSPTKPAAPRPSAPRPATAPTSRTTITRTTTSTVSAAPKPRPTSLASKTPTTTSSVTKSATATKSPPPKISPRTTTAPRPKPPVSTTLSKPRVPLTKTITKTADTEKQNKESANKLTASRSVTSATRTTSATSRTMSTTVRKVESKVAATRTSKTTTTTMKSTTARKPAEIVRHATTTKTKTTKVEKPKENGISTVVTEEITVVSNANANVIDASEPQLVKDNSPVDNKLITETTLIQTSTAD